MVLDFHGFVQFVNFFLMVDGYNMDEFLECS